MLPSYLTRPENAIGENTRLILWTQHAHNQPVMQQLQNPAQRDVYDGIAMVSDWQRDRFHQQFNIALTRSCVLRNAIAPVFGKLFSDSTPILAHKSNPPILAYTSTPFRGLDILLEVFPRIRKAVPGTRLKVFSSMKVYQFAQAADESEFGVLYRKCRETEGVEYIGSIPQPDLARELRSVTVLAYPNTFAETSCIAVMEAMASGCFVVTSNLAALPETTAGFARLIPIEGDWEAYKNRFVEETVQVLRESTAADNTNAETHLRRQVNYVNREYTWSVRAGNWVEWLSSIQTKTAISADLQQQAYQCLIQGKYSQAATLYEQAIEACPEVMSNYWGSSVVSVPKYYNKAGGREGLVAIMKRVMTKLLNLPGVIVEDSKETAETLILSVRVEKKTAACPHCGRLSHRLHQNKGHLVRDLPIGGREVILKVNRRRFKCENCQKPFSETLGFVGNKKSFTYRYAQKVTEQVIHSDVSNVAKNNGLTAEEVWSMVISVAKKVIPINVENLKILGIDEISLVKGQGKFIVVLVDLETHKLLGLVPSRTQSQIEKVMRQWGEKVLSQIEEVSMDMTGNYKSLIQKMCQNAQVTVDRFHLTKIVMEELNSARIDQKKTAEALSVKKRAKLFSSLKGSKYTLLKNEKSLSEKQKEKLEQVKQASPTVAIMHELKEELHLLFEESKTLGEGTLKLIDWLKKAEPYYRNSVATIKRWFPEVVGYFEKRTTNGIVEGINNKLKLLKRCGFGFNNFHNFEIRA